MTHQRRHTRHSKKGFVFWAGKRIPESSAKLRRVIGNKQLIFAHAISHSGVWRKAIGKTYQRADQAYFHKEMRKRGFVVHK